jgi:N-acetylglucosaminyldiphosphoundecaprenol N-acetyl-beta-D-mannosaminyltransferase
MNPSTPSPLIPSQTLADVGAGLNSPFIVGAAPPTPATEQPADGSASLPAVPTTHVWGIDFALVNMADVIQRADRLISSRQCEYFITANLNYLMLTSQHPDLAQVNAQADLMIADGFPIVWRSRWQSTRLPGRVAGSDMIVELARLSAEKGYRIYFLGGAPGVAEKAAAKLHSMFPALQIAGCCAPPFRPLSDAEQAAMFDDIRNSRADILLVAFGQPKGERWIHQHYRQLNIPLSIQLGASFDFLAGTAKRAPKFWQWIGGEWLYRTLNEPKRLGPRYLGNVAFLLRCIARDFVPRLSKSRDEGENSLA